MSRSAALFVLLAVLALVALGLGQTEDDDAFRSDPSEQPPTDFVVVPGGLFSSRFEYSLHEESEAADSGMLSCLGEDSGSPNTEDIEQRAIDMFTNVYPVLAATKDAEFVLAAAMLQPPEALYRADEYLAKAGQLNPESRLVLWNQLLACSEGDARDCDVTAVRARALALDGSNGAVWMKIAADYLAADREQQALDAVRRAVAAPRFDEYWIDQVLLLDRAFAASTDWPLAERVVKAIGLTAAMPFPTTSLYEKCKKPGKDTAVWMELCDQLGQKMFVDGRTIITRGIGLGYRKVAADLALNPGRVAQVSKLKKEFLEDYSKLFKHREAMNLVFNDERVLRDYLDNFATYGELEAFTRLIAEASRLQAMPEYDQCNFVSSSPYGY